MDCRRLFTMNTDYISSSRDKIRHTLFRFHDHQVYIQRKICHRAQGIHHKRSNCDVWNKTTIHYISMNPITTCQFYSFYLWGLRLGRRSNSEMGSNVYYSQASKHQQMQRSIKIQSKIR
uniref:Uncharacterized protein n=1 Tax=Rhizophora mucronata TaxID=61149 RepID=A0A2P2JSW0_RHIMU